MARVTNLGLKCATTIAASVFLQSLLSSCAGSSPAASPPREVSVASKSAASSAPIPTKAEAERASDPDAGAKTESPPKEEEPSFCPEEMVLVEGEYCTAKSNKAVPDEYGNTPGGGAADLKIVERECLKEWYAPQNKKRVCEEFETKGVCVGKMVKKRFCIDRYSWPNKKGHRPEVMNRYHQAQLKCAAVGKRMCTESEWTFSCEGPDMKPFPYGYVRDATKCHGDETWDGPNMTKVAQRDQTELRRLYKGKASGQPECVSDFGVYDLPGNNDEVVASETFESGWRGKFESTNTGGPWYKGVRNQCRPKIYTHDEGFYHYFLGFRCCAEAGDEAEPRPETNPLTPHQKKEGWDMKRVERIAGITLDEMRKLLEKKKTDPSCGCTTTKCKTYCGTLLGDEWGNPVSETPETSKP